jgi:hypothetical protein
MTDLDSADFSAVDWINAHLAASGTPYGQQTDQLLARLQLEGREVAQTTDQHIRTLVADLPQAMAKLSQIGSRVHEISDSVRGLTNSGYRFKSGNVPDKITALSSLKVRRDRVREASETLRLGMDFEAQLATLRDFAPTGGLRAVCARFEAVARAAAALAPIPKFRRLQAQVQELQRAIAGRLRPELAHACAQRSADAFVAAGQHARQIAAADLPGAVLLARYREELAAVVGGLATESLAITQWIKPCFERCREVTAKFTAWSLGLKPALFEPEIKVDFLRAMSQLLTEAIEPRAKSLLKSTDFPSIAQVMGAMKQFAEEWPEGADFFLRGCIDSIHGAFPDVFAGYLASHLQGPPKSSLKSPRAPARPDSPAQSPRPKLSELVTVGIRCLPWIRVLSRDFPGALRLLCDFLAKAIDQAVAERGRQRQPPDERNFEVALVELSQQFLAQEEIRRRLTQFETEAAAFCPLSSRPSDGIDKLQAAIECEIVDVMAVRAIKTLADVPAAKDWTAEVAEEEAVVFEGKSRYVGRISSHLISLVRQLSDNNRVAEDLIARWMVLTVSRVLSACLGEFRKIEALSSYGKKQLLADVEELQNVFANWLPEEESKAALMEIVGQLKREVDQRITGVADVHQRIDDALKKLRLRAPSRESSIE